MNNTKAAQRFGRSDFGVLLFFLILVCSALAGTAQQRGKRNPLKSLNIQNLDDTLVPVLANRISSYTFTINRDSFLLSKDYDLQPIEAQLPAIEKQIKGFHSIFSRLGQSMNLRGLSTSIIILKDVVEKLEVFQSELSSYRDTLKASNDKIRAIVHDTTLVRGVHDTALNQEIEWILKRARKLNFSQRIMLAKINLLNSRVSVNLSETNDIVSDMIFLTIDKKTRLFIPERQSLFSGNPGDYQQKTTENIAQGLSVSWRVIQIYILTRITLFSFFAIIFLSLIFLILLDSGKLRKRTRIQTASEQKLRLSRNLISGSVLLISILIPLFFADPPAALLHAFDLLRLIALTLIISRLLTIRSKWLWAVYAVLCIVFMLDDLLLRDSFGERWLLFLAGILLTCVYAIAMRQRRTLFRTLAYSAVTNAILIIGIIIASLSVIFNVTGNFALSKITGITAIQTTFIALSLKVVSSLLAADNDLLFRKKYTSRLLAFFGLTKTGITRTLWVLATVVWFIFILRALTLYNVTIFALDKLLFTARPIGKYHFTFSDIITFFLILWLTSFLSKIINYSFGREKAPSTGKNTRLNSLSLIFRLFVWTAGFLIAVTAAGIPLDRISILLGALGVGIGFGLQNIVNNVVSGIILAFERPVRAGDQIEVSGKTGIIREIGIRASKINNTEGADIIIPNGDLLSQHLINWTMQNKNKRVEFTMAVPYDTDLEKIRFIILESLKNHEDILHDPLPSLVLSEFAQLGVELKVMFWVPDLFSIDSIRTEVMIEIKELLHKAGVNLQPAVYNPIVPKKP